MTKVVAILFFLFLSCFGMAGLPPTITLSIPPESSVEGRDIPLYITIVHSPQDVIDESSFVLEDVSFKVTVVQKEKVAPEKLFKGQEEEALQVHRYRGNLPSRKAGLYTVGPISVTINNIRYTSGSISMDVQGAVTSPVLRLEVKPLGVSKIFPGQEVSFEYRLYYQRPIRLTREDLPLLRVNGFLNVGAPVVSTQETSEGGMQSIVQKARAQYPGVFSVRESVIEGFEVDASGEEPRIIPPLYRATAEPIDLTVRPFPEQGRPPVFEGAIGSFVWRVSSLDGMDVKVGQPVRIEYRVSGRGDLATVQFPSLNQMVGLHESFWTESLPPVGEEVDGVKKFLLIVRPKRLGRVEVPGFFAYSFDSVSEKYLTVAVSPVSLQVKGSKESGTTAGAMTFISTGGFSPLHVLTPVLAKTKDIPDSFVFSLLVAALVIGIVEFFFCKQLQREKKAVTSQKIFFNAIAKGGYEGLRMLQQAFFRRLFEVGATVAIAESPSQIPDEGLWGEIKGYLQSIDEALYRKDIPAASFEVFFEEAKGLYQKVKQLPSIH